MQHSFNPANAHRWVFLRHDTPDGGYHFDWMLERPPRASDQQQRRLLTFRLATHPESLAEPGRQVSRLTDHRVQYLDFQGPLTNDRGSVRRLDRGDWNIIHCDADSVQGLVMILDRVYRLRARLIDQPLRNESEIWTLSMTPT